MVVFYCLLRNKIISKPFRKWASKTILMSKPPRKLLMSKPPPNNVFQTGRPFFLITNFLYFFYESFLLKLTKKYNFHCILFFVVILGAWKPDILINEYSGYIQSYLIRHLAYTFCSIITNIYIKKQELIWAIDSSYEFNRKRWRTISDIAIFRKLIIEQGFKTL